MASSPLWRGGGKIFPNSPDENFTHKVNKKMYPCRHQLDSLRVGTSGSSAGSGRVQRGYAQNQGDGAEDQELGFDKVMIVTDDMDENLYLSSRNLPHVLVLEAHHADPVSLVRLPQCVDDPRCGQEIRGDAGMNAQNPNKSA